MLQQVPLLVTKLRIPPTRAKMVLRPRLTERLNEGMKRKLTLVQAPAGFGKTTLLSEWGRQSKSPVAWVSLDKGDNDPVRFCAYFLAALQTIQAGIGGDVRSLLHSPQPAPIQNILTVLINEIVTVPDDFALVLDDYHVINAQPIHSAMAFLLDHLPPQMHLVIATRARPPLLLARLRAQRQLTELAAGDLRFLLDEAAHFLNQVMGLDLSPENVAALQEYTEGWIAGLQLVALSVREYEGTTGFIETFTGSDRYILNYLGEEVFRRQSKNIQAFLLQTSILERLSGSLCDAVTGQDDGQAMLEALERANLFIFPLDHRQRWYRYHQLFADFLRAHLKRTDPGLVPVLHSRASEWYEHNGLAAEAIDHALAAGNLERVADLVDWSGRTALVSGRLATLMNWLDALPESLVRSRPQLCLIHAWILLTRDYQFDAAEARLQDAECALSYAADRTTDLSTERSAEGPLLGKRQNVLGEIATARAYTARIQGDMSRALALSNQALELLPNDQVDVRGLATWIRGLAYRYSGDVAAASQSLVETHTLSQASSQIGLALTAIDNLAKVQVMEGHLRQANETRRQAFELIGRQAREHLPITSLIYIGLSGLLYEWNDLEAALGQVSKGIRLARQGELTGPLLHAYVKLARVKQAQGDAESALAAIQDAAQLVRGHAATLHAAEVTAFRVRLWLAQGNLEAAARWARECGLSVDDELAYHRELEYLTLVRVLIAQGRRDTGGRLLHDALKLLDRNLQAAQASGRMGSVIEILALQALALHAQGETARAMVALERALSLAEPEGYIRLFVDEGGLMAKLLHQAASRGLMPDYTRRLLAAFGDIIAPSPPEPKPYVEPLSEREIEVLRLLAARLSSQEMAQELVISVNTVRTHIRNIYRKLDVHSRTQAVERARALKLLPPYLPPWG